MAGKQQRPTFVPSPEQMALWPEISGNKINGLGEKEPRRPTPIYWHAPDETPHGPLQLWFYKHNLGNPSIAATRETRQKIIDAPLPPVAEKQELRSPEDWVKKVKGFEMQIDGIHIGITPMQPEWVFEGKTLDIPWLIMIVVKMDYEPIKDAPSDESLKEIIEKYGYGLKAAKQIAAWVRDHGWDAYGHCGPEAGATLLIPAAIEAGLGELGKHGSLISPRYGASCRIACVQTNLPLVADALAPFGADDYCFNCKACERACPPDALTSEKHWVRGEKKWYVDFDKCLPFFNENGSCGACLASCPWSKPGVPEKLTAKLKKRAMQKSRL
ncbi:MAG: 4Fe-4S dicluster domain-containing protein [Rhodospirillales bacterium]|nr:4Fe-4S dicluster domain-containing protein [Rhodospirillales bacterium]